MGTLDDQDDEEAEAIRSTERIKADFERVQAAQPQSGYVSADIQKVQYEADRDPVVMYVAAVHAVPWDDELDGSGKRNPCAMGRSVDPDGALADLAVQVAAKRAKLAGAPSPEAIEAGRLGEVA